MTKKSGILLLTYIAVFNSEKSVIWGESRINITKVETKLSETNIVLILKKMFLHLHKIQKTNNKNRNVYIEKDDSIKLLIAKGDAS